MRRRCAALPATLPCGAVQLAVRERGTLRLAALRLALSSSAPVAQESAAAPASAALVARNGHLPPVLPGAEHAT